MAGHYVTVHSGQQLLDQLANATARYIGVSSDLTVPPNLGMRRVVVSRCASLAVVWQVGWLSSSCIAAILHIITAHRAHHYCYFTPYWEKRHPTSQHMASRPSKLPMRLCSHVFSPQRSHDHVSTVRAHDRTHAWGYLT